MIEIQYKPTGEIFKIDSFWLRDHCCCILCYNAETKQRKYNLIELPADVQPKVTKYTKDGMNFEVNWSDGHVSSYDLQFIYEAQFEQHIKRRQRNNACRTNWNREIVLKNEHLLRIELSQLISSDQAVYRLVDNLVRYGIVFVDKIAPNPTMTELAVRRVFPIMKTFFGEMYTFCDVPDHADTAYTKEYLGSHTDNTYFCDAAGLQALHCIVHEGGSGGENFFVDGLYVAHELKRRNPRAFELLSHIHVPAEYIEENEYHKHSAPIIRTDPLTGEIVQLRLNIYDRATLNALPQHQMQEFYASFRELLAIVESDDNRWTLKLHPGTMVIFDNWRVLHGRCAYTGFRKVTGCYVQRTDFLSKARLLGIID